MADITQQTPASEHDGFIYGLESSSRYLKADNELNFS